VEALVADALTLLEDRTEGWAFTLVSVQTGIAPARLLVTTTGVPAEAPGLLVNASIAVQGADPPKRGRETLQ